MILWAWTTATGRPWTPSASATSWGSGAHTAIRATRPARYARCCWLRRRNCTRAISWPVFTLRDTWKFDDWQSLQTETLRRELAGVLEGLAEGYAARGRVRERIAYAYRWATLKPLYEGAHRCLMPLYARSGETTAVPRQYAACERKLREQLGGLPSPETTQLRWAIRWQRPFPRYHRTGPGSGPGDGRNWTTPGLAGHGRLSDEQPGGGLPGPALCQLYRRLRGK